MMAGLHDRLRLALAAPREPPVISGAVRLLTGVLFRPLTYGVLRGHRIGQHRIPRRGAVLVVCNHVSVADPIVVPTAMAPRRAWIMAKSELYRVRPLAWWMSRQGAFPVERASAGRGAIRTARELLARGECVLVYPEGRVTRSGILRPGLPGAGNLALMDGVTVVPAVVWNTQLFRGPVRVRFGAPVPMRDLRRGRRPGRNQAATDRIMDAIAALLPLAGGPVVGPPRGGAGD